MAKEKVGGVYIIRHKHTNAFYVGSTVDFAYRKRLHWHTIRVGKRGAPYLRRLANATGNNVDDFTFSPLLVCAAEHRTLYENRALRLFHGTDGCLNALGAGNVPDAETREKMRASGKRKTFTPEHRAAISAGLAGKRRVPMAEETKAKLSAWRTGRKAPPRSAETCAKLSAANKGKSPWTKGKTMPAETRAKIRAAQQGENGYWFGKSFSPEQRAKMSAAHTARYARLREEARMAEISSVNLK